MAKKLDLNRTVFELTKEYPELIGIMEELGFSEITKKAMLHSVGRLTTIPKGAKMRGIPMMEVIGALMKHGFEITGEAPEMAMSETKSSPETAEASVSQDERTRQLKAYLRRLGEGEDLERVRADFVREFSEVDASEIMKAEQELMKEGTPLSEVQRLCDVHSALFHGIIKEEKGTATETPTQDAGREQTGKPQADYSNKIERAATLEAITGHPLQTLTRENEKLAALLEEMRETLAKEGEIAALLAELRTLSVHYAKKGDLLYPHLKVAYDISGPSDVMWTVDDEIRDELAALEREEDRGEWWKTRMENVLKRVEEMIYKEQNILFPICAVNFTEQEWKEIYRDAKDYAVCFGADSEIWEEAETADREDATLGENEVVMPGGHLTVPQLTAMLNTIPLEITFVDADNINRYFNEGEKVFKRPGMAIDREVFSCHPPKIEPMVRAILDDFRTGKRDSVPVWMEKGGRTMLVTYMAVRDREGTYLGTVELVQDMEFAKEHFGIKS